MKKTLFALLATAAMGAATLNAATVTWTATMVKYNEVPVSGAAYIYFAPTADTSWVATLDQCDAATVSSAITEHSPALNYTSSTAGNYSYNTTQGFTPKTNAELGLTGETKYDAYLVLFDTTEIDEGSHFLATLIKSFTTKADGLSQSVNVIFGGQSSATWYTVASATTPEPATATLSLLALAGLAARRRRH